MKGKTLIIIDVDGTLSDNGHRFDLLPRGEDVHNADKWLKFNEACIYDTINPIGVGILDSLITKFGESAHYIIASARDGRVLPLTREWIPERVPRLGHALRYYKNHGLNRYYFRESDDHRPSAMVKRDLFTTIRLEHDPFNEAQRIYLEDDDASIRMIEAIDPGAAIIRIPSTCCAAVRYASPEFPFDTQASQQARQHRAHVVKVLCEQVYDGGCHLRDLSMSDDHHRDAVAGHGEVLVGPCTAAQYLNGCPDRAFLLGVYATQGQLVGALSLHGYDDPDQGRILHVETFGGRCGDPSWILGNALALADKLHAILGGAARA